MARWDSAGIPSGTWSVWVIGRSVDSICPLARFSHSSQRPKQKRSIYTFPPNTHLRFTALPPLRAMEQTAANGHHPGFSCRCLNVRVSSRSPSEPPPEPTDPRYALFFVGEDGISVVSTHCPTYRNRETLSIITGHLYRHTTNSLSGPAVRREKRSRATSPS